MAALANYPTIRPTLDLRFTENVDPRITFTRASAATYWDANGVLRTAPAGVPRIDYHPSTGKCLGLLVEEQRTNLLTYSEQIDNAAWTTSRIDTTPNAIYAPDGTQSADLLIPTTELGLSVTRQIFTGANTSSTYTWSGYAKQGPGSYVLCIAYGSDNATGGINTVNRGYAKFNLSAVTAGMAGKNGDASNVSASIAPVGNGWFRCVFTFIPDTTGASTAFSVGPAPAPAGQNPALSWSGDGTSGVYIWGAQLELGAFPTSYIKTEAAQVTRLADVAFMSGANFSDWYHSPEGTVLWQGGVLSTGRHAGGGNNFPVLFDIDSGDGPFASHMALVSAGYGPGIATQISDTALTRTRTVATPIPDLALKYALAYSEASSGVAVKGSYSAFSQQLSQPPVSATRMSIGTVNGVTGINSLTAHIRRITYYPRRLSRDQLIALTA